MLDMMQSAATNGEVYQSSGQNSTSRARDLGLRAQKKILGRFASSNAGRSILIDDATSSLLDNLYRLMDRSAKNSPNIDKKLPEKVLKNIVKLSIKIGLLHRNNQLDENDFKKINEIRKSLKSVAMAVISFYELEFSFDRIYLTKLLENCRSSIQSLIKTHLTDKSVERCDIIFNFLTNSDFLDCIFSHNSELRPILELLVNDINKALDAGQL